MEDRDVQFPNRYRVTKVEGTDDIYDFEPVPGEVKKEGSLVNKSLLFDDVVAGLFNLSGEDATPNKAFEFLGKFNQHWWKRRALAGSYTEVKTEKSVNSLATGDTGDFIIRLHDDSGANNVYTITADLKYSDKINIDQSNGEITLVSPKTISGINARSIVSTELSTITGKYIQSKTVKKTGGTVDNGIYLIPDVLSEDIYSGLSGTVMWGAWTNPMYKITSKKVTDKGDWEYIFSGDRLAYPDSGEQDGYEYQYLGVPFENAKEAPKVVTGSYIGTGTYGSNNPTSISFDSPVKMFFVHTINNRSQYDSIVFIVVPAIDGVKDVFPFWYIGPQLNSNYYVDYLKISGNTVKWYNDQSAQYQLNESEYIYYYTAIL